jgi:hypothetical protein
MGGAGIMAKIRCGDAVAVVKIGYGGKRVRDSQAIARPYLAMITSAVYMVY